MMIKKRIIAATAALLAAFSLTCGCENPKESEVEENNYESNEKFDEMFKDVPDSEEGPLLTIKDTTAKAGEVAEVTISVENAEGKWNFCGLHIIYPEELDCVNISDDKPDAEYTPGDACRRLNLNTAMEWQGKRPEELEDREVGAAFYTAVSTENNGKDGDIVTFYLKIPDDAESGDEYPVDFYYYNTDHFKGVENDLAFEKYAFSHWKGGTITVE